MSQRARKPTRVFKDQTAAQTLLVGGGGHGDGVTERGGHAFRAVCKQMGSRAALDVVRSPYLSDMLHVYDGCAEVDFILFKA